MNQSATSSYTSQSFDAGNIDSTAVMHPSSDTIRLLSTAISSVLQPCNLINKILGEVINMVPSASKLQESPSQSTEKQPEIVKQNTATNTSDNPTPAMRAGPSNQEIEALFKEAAKELEKMNEIVNFSTNKIPSLTSSMTSTSTGATQIERATSPLLLQSTEADQVDNAENAQIEKESMTESQGDFSYQKIDSPSKSMLSRESSIEIRGETSDDSREWTILDAQSLLPSIPPRLVNKKTGAIPKGIVISDSSDSENEGDAFMSSSGETVKTDDSTKFIANEKTSSELNKIQKPTEITEVPVPIEEAPKAPEIPARNNIWKITAQPEETSVQSPLVSYQKITPIVVQQTPELYPKLPSAFPLASTPANMKANRYSTVAPSAPTVKFGPAVVQYDPNPKINTAIHTMMNMGFSNDGDWLTQLLVNVDGDIPKALQFLTPTPKKPQN